jgi:hypothetical protein
MNNKIIIFIGIVGVCLFVASSILGATVIKKQQLTMFDSN